MRAPRSSGPTETYGPWKVRADASATARPPERRGDDDARFGAGARRSAAPPRSSTDPFEQIGHSAVKRLWRQKSEDMANPQVGTTYLLEGLRARACQHAPAMTTAVLSDLHLGTRSQADILRRPALRKLLFERIEQADEVVLLGDVLELREQALRGVLEIALPFFAELGDALPGRR